MYVFGLNLPLPEFFFILVIIFLVLLIIIVNQLQRLQRMTSEEQQELYQLEKLAEEEKKDLDEIRKFETEENSDLNKFEKEIEELEEDTETLYLKRLAPDLYKIMNYVVWAKNKGYSNEQIKQNLESKGWKDNKLVDMVINDITKYKGYYKEDRSLIDKNENLEVSSTNVNEIKDLSSNEQPKEFEKNETSTQSVVKIVEKPIIIHHKTEKSGKERSKTKKEKSKKTKQKKSKQKIKKIKRKSKSSFSSVERELAKLEKELKARGENKIKEKNILSKKIKKNNKKEKTNKTKLLKTKKSVKKNINKLTKKVKEKKLQIEKNDKIKDTNKELQKEQTNNEINQQPKVVVQTEKGVNVEVKVNP
ncbi:MAG: hypothetical protein QW757_04900 [Candidatus Woesearchaeota archaeon]